MADNIILSAGDGTGGTVATDEVSSRHFQIVKLAEGGDGVAVLVSGSTPLSVKGTTDFPMPIFGSVSIIGTIPITGATTGTVFISGTSPVSGSVSIIGGTVGVNVTGGALTGTSPISGSVTIIGTVATTATITMGTVPALLGTSQVAGSVSIINGSVTTQVTSGSVNVRNLGGSVNIGGGTLAAITGTVTVVGSVNTTASVTMGTVPAITSTVSVVASPGDAQAQWGAGSIDVIQVGLITPAGTVAANAGLPISGTLAAITGTVSVVGSVNTNASVTMGTVPSVLAGSINVRNQGGSLEVTAGSLNIRNQGGSVNIGGGTLAAITGTVTVVGSVTTSATIGTIDTIGSANVFITGGSLNTTAEVVMGTVPALLSGSVNISNQGGSVQISGGTLAAITGTVPVSGSVSIIGGTVGANITGGALTGTSPVSGSVSIIQGSLNIRNQGGSVQVSAIVGTLPDKNQNQTIRVPEGTTANLLGSVGATGDYISHLVCIVGSTAANMVTLIDGSAVTGSGWFGTVLPSVPGPGKAPYTIPVDAYSRFGPWKVSTEGGAHVVAVGRFTN